MSDSAETVKWGVKFSRDSEMGCQIQQRQWRKGGGCLTEDLTGDGGGGGARSISGEEGHEFVVFDEGLRLVHVGRGFRRVVRHGVDGDVDGSEITQTALSTRHTHRQC